MSQDPIKALFDMMKHYDSDNRFMAANGLTDEMLKENCKMNDAQKDQCITLLLESFHDKTQEVQTNSVRNISKIIGKVPQKTQERIITTIMTTMSENEVPKKDGVNILDVYATCLKTIIKEYKPDNNESFIFMIADRLINSIEKAPPNKKEIYLEIAYEMFHKYMIEFKASPEKIKRDKYLNQLLTCLATPAWRKATQCLGVVSPILTIKEASECVGKLLIKLEKDADKLVPLQCLSAMSAHSAQCFIPSIRVIIPLLLSYCKDLKCEQYNEQVIKCNKADAALITIVNLFNKIPKEMSEFSNILLNTADVYISFDPGYDESVAVPMEDDSGWGTEAVNDVNNLDDDMSWKVRKGCAQIIESIAKLRPDDVKLTYLKIVEKLQTRLTERDDNVRKEVVNAFVAMIKSSMVEIIDSSMNLSIGNMDSVFGLEPLSMGKQKSSFQDIVSIIPDIIKKLIVMISDKKPDIILLGLQALSAITLAYCNLVHSNIADVVKAFGNIIKDETISCSVSALNILKTLFKNCGSIKIFSPYLENINAIMTTAFNSKHNKIVYEALKASCEYAKILHPIEKQPLSPECAPYATKLYALIEKLFMATELELSIKDISGISMGKIVQYLGSIISDAKMEAILLKYKEKLESESTRIHALKSLFLVIKSIPEGKYEKCLLAIIPEVSALIRQKSRRFRMLGVQLLQAIESKFPKLVQQKSKDFIDDMLHSPLEEDAGITNIILQITVQVLPHISKDLTESVYGMAKKLIKSSNIKDNDISIVNKIFEILVSWKNLDEMFKDLILDIGTCDIASVAMCVAYLCLKFDNKSILIQCIQNVVKTGVEKNLKKLSLYIIGEIGKIKDLSKEKELCDSIFKQLINETEEIKSICANCLGRLVIGNTAYFLPIIMEQIKSKKQSYLMLIAIREVIITNSAALDKYLDKIMSLIQETASAAEQGIRIIIAEIIGKLYQEYKQKAEQWIINLMKDPNPSISSAFLLSFKYATNRQNVDFTLINNVIPQILEILKKSNDLVIKENGFTSLTTLAYNIPNIISLYSDQINALISVEATINKSLIKLIDFGAFKMTEDTGAPVRKQALSLLQVMVMKCNDKVNYSQVFKQVADGLNDDNEDCLTLCYQLISQFAFTGRNHLVSNIQNVVENMKKMLDNRLEQLAKNKSVENSKEKILMIFRALQIFEKVPELESSEILKPFLEEFKKNPKVAKITQDNK